ncbi:MAG: LysM peptidoglycan-binding domain-containing protein [Anaerolineaceae bacterium]|mgnify:CR=1 FL=1|jgi:LysM repeat protein|nr:LysM peptidoglycan-binding domain-containing protein [Anaerolineaceae bacterium]MDD4043243.1 LysM peptidoglycan-binding domain-containing protein [Anaerolineaceae bacterium]MDD4577473.1 LysM peptidoglycan-binding domain-containing protein [Anaerolineaceae bacterium]
MHKNVKSRLLLFFVVLAIALAPIKTFEVSAEVNLAPHQQVAAYELISAMNVLRMGNGLPALIENATINAVAQATAQTMADGLLSWHIGNVSGRIAAAGYGAGKTVYATENFAVAYGGSIDQIMLMWADYDHMRPATSPNYCHVGAGTALASNGMTYYILQAAYISGEACDATPPTGGGGTPGQPPAGYGIVTPVEKVELNEEGNYVHEVKPGQSLWSIAVAYGVTIKEILAWNNLPESYVLWPGDKLTIAGPDSRALVTPTPMGNVLIAAPAADGSIVHEVQPYQYLSTIAQAYGVSVDTILGLNFWKVDWPLSIGQKLIIRGPDQTPTPTPLPLTPLQRLTPGADGKYYHTVAEGQTLEWIANLYGVPLADLMSWNYLNASSIIYPGERLFLDVTPPPTLTPTPVPATDTPVPTPTYTPSPSPTATRVLSPAPTATETLTGLSLAANPTNWLWLLAVAAIGVAGYFVVSAKKVKKQ